jgi:hypothetical protein
MAKNEWGIIDTLTLDGEKVYLYDKDLIKFLTEEADHCSNEAKIATDPAEKVRLFGISNYLYRLCETFRNGREEDPKDED